MFRATHSQPDLFRAFTWSSSLSAIGRDSYLVIFSLFFLTLSILLISIFLIRILSIRILPIDRPQRFLVFARMIV